jgi:ribosomal protein S18 acetylase RimI-like enzyme
MIIRRATKEDIDKLIENRIKFVTDIVATPSDESFFDNTYEFFKNHINKDDLIVWLAVDDDKIIATVILCIYRVLPTVANATGKTGYILNVWTDEKYRRQGLATKLLINTMEDAKKAGVNRIHLKATEQGKFVYEKLGFFVEPNEMAIKL